MATIKVVRRDAHRPSRTSFTWHRQPSVPSCGKVCSFWLAGNCTRNPCRFLHSEAAPTTSCTAPPDHSAPKQSHHSQGRTKKPERKMCEYWVTGNCVYGDKCKYLHSWCCGDGLSSLTHLEGHKKVPLILPCFYMLFVDCLFYNGELVIT